MSFDDALYNFNGKLTQTGDSLERVWLTQKVYPFFIFVPRVPLRTGSWGLVSGVEEKGSDNFLSNGEDGKHPVEVDRGTLFSFKDLRRAGDCLALFGGVTCKGSDSMLP